MKFSTSTLRLILPAVAGLFAVSCGKNKVADTNPYQNNPYYGPSSSTYGTGSTDTASTYDYGSSSTSSYPTYTDNSYTPPAPAPAPAPTYNDTYAASSYGGGSTHTVQPGDNLFRLSQRYGTSVSAIQSANGLSGDLIRVGETLTIPRG